MGRLVKPARPRLVGDHPLGPGAGLRHLWPLSEGGGLATRDEVTLATASLVGSPLWANGPYGPYLGFIGASSQYVDAGPIPWLSGAPAFTLVVIQRRTTSGDNFAIHIGASFGTTIGISGSTFVTCRVGTGAGDAYSQVPNTTDEWQHIVMAFDGSQATALDRVALYINGVQQSMTMGAGTFPTTAPSSTDSLRIGAAEFVSFFGTGQSTGTWLYDRTFTASNAADHYADPWGMVEMPALRRRLFAGIYVPPVVSAIPSDLFPADDATGVDPGSEVAVSWTPTDTMNPIDTITITVNGVEQESEEVSIGGSGIRASCVPPLYQYQVNEFSSVCTTQDDNTNTVEWEATPARTRASASSALDYLIPAARSAPGVLDWAIPRAAAAPAEVGWLIPDSNVRTGATQVVEYAPQARADGLLAGTNVQVDFLATLQAYTRCILLGAEIGEGHTNPVPTGASITGTERAATLTGATIAGTERQTIAALGANIAIQSRHTLVLLGAIVGAYGRNPVPTGARVNAWTANFVLEFIVRSLHQQSIEEEP